MQIAAALQEGGYGKRETVLRVNGIATPWHRDDLLFAAKLPVNAVLLPKVESAQDVRATLAGLGDQGQAPLQVRFGNSDFVNKYRLLIENIAHWRADVGRVDSVDLRFSRQVVVNPESEAALVDELRITLLSIAKGNPPVMKWISLL